MSASATIGLDLWKLPDFSYIFSALHYLKLAAKQAQKLRDNRQGGVSLGWSRVLHDGHNDDDGGYRELHGERELRGDVEGDVAMAMWKSEV